MTRQGPLSCIAAQRPVSLVSEGGLEPPRPIRGLAPQASASAYSATRTSAVTLARLTAHRVIGRVCHQPPGSGRPSANPAGDWTPTTARSANSSRSCAPAYVQAERTPEQISSTRSSTPGPFGVEEHPRGRDALLVEGLAGTVEGAVGRRTVGDRAGRGHPEALLVGTAVGVDVQVARRLVGPGEPGADHHLGRAGGQGERDVARVAHSPVGPDVLAVAAGRLDALDDGAELRPADAGHHPGRAHRAGPDADLDDVRARLDEVVHAVGGRRRCRRRSGPSGRPSARPPSASSIRSWCPCAVSTTRQSTPIASSRLALPATSPLTPIAAAIRSRPRWSSAGR